MGAYCRKQSLDETRQGTAEHGRPLVHAAQVAVRKTNQTKPEIKRKRKKNHFSADAQQEDVALEVGQKTSRGH